MLTSKFAKRKSNLLRAAILTSLAVTLGACSPEQVKMSPQAQSDASFLSEANNYDDAHWLDKTHLAINLPKDIEAFELISTDINGQISKIALSSDKWPEALKNKFPHLSEYQVLVVPDDAEVKTLLKGQNQLLLKTKEQQLLSDVQTYGAIDDVYTSGNNDANEIMDFGATVLDDKISFKLWAPTATEVELLLFDQNKTPITKVTMSEDTATGTWQAEGTKSLEFAYYQYQLSVFHPLTDKFETLVTTDPYSLSLSTNSKYTQIIDLDHGQTKPAGWDNHKVPVVENPEDLILYETHIRDFSASDKQLSDVSYRGKYKAFTESQSSGMKHLLKLRDAGLNTVHLLPTYDISTVNEETVQHLSLDDSMGKVCEFYPKLEVCTEQQDKSASLRSLLTSYDPRTGDAQAIIEQIRGNDDYNWGYDPYHYTVPEGSYALNPDGESRIVEFREMVANLHSLGFKVIMDVVYNHTFESGVGEKSVLDKVVPGYYHRYNIRTGAMETSTCCDNSATEHAMMEKLMTDSLVVWARDHKIDGFRFDLMGHQPKDAMLRSREAVRAVDPDTYFYGEGWNFGEVANNAQFVQASQNELGGTEIGTFTDRLRDAVRGGNFMTNADGLRRDQGIGNGLYVVPNDLQDETRQADHYYNSMDIVRLGLAGNLKQFKLQNILGETIDGSQVLYGGSPAGYALDPADTINYVSKHDNQTLWDNHQYRLPYDMPTSQRVRLHNMSLAYPLMAQGIPFLHMGSELMRSKSFLRDSYDYGDWFNAVDFTYQSNNYDVGLPPEVKDRDNWPTIQRLLKHNKLNDDVTPEQIEFSANVFADFIKIRSSSKLFRLTSGQDVLDRVTFLNDGKDHKPGLIVMQLSDEQGDDLDTAFENIVVVFNNNPEPQNVAITNAEKYRLHPVQQNGTDELVKQATSSNKHLSIPGFTTAVFVQ